MSFCPISDIKLLLGISGEDESKDSLIQVCISSSQAVIESYCNRKFELAFYSEQYDGGSDRLVLNQFPVVINKEKDFKVYVDMDREFTEDTLLPTDDYYVDTESGIVYFDTIFIDWRNVKAHGVIKVEYWAGYRVDDEVNELPSDLIMVCKEMVLRKLKMIQSGDVGLVSKGTPGGVSLSFSQSDFLPEHKVILDSYRSVR